MKARIRTAAILLLSALFLFSSCSSETPKSDYERNVLQKITEGPESENRLAPFTDDLCVIDPDQSFDEKLIPALYAGLFNESTKEVLYAKNVFERV